VGPNALAIQADSANLSDLSRLYSEVKSRYGRIDVLVANLGGGSTAPRRRRFSHSHGVKCQH
jgi:NAD(P)-dependent dehydrogenase (short-subunit alcohol dehydrogenase family)